MTDLTSTQGVFLMDIYSLITGTSFEYQAIRKSMSSPIGFDSAHAALHAYAADRIAEAGQKENLNMFEAFAKSHQESGGAENAVSDVYRELFPGLSGYPAPSFTSDPDSLSERLSEERAFAVRLEKAFGKFLDCPPITALASRQQAAEIYI